jgi:hypothetical protein
MGFELSPSWKSGLSQAIAAAHRLNWGRAGVAGGLGLRVVGLTRACHPRPWLGNGLIENFTAKPILNGLSSLLPLVAKKAGT